MMNGILLENLQNKNNILSNLKKSIRSNNKLLHNEINNNNQIKTANLKNQMK